MGINFSPFEIGRRALQASQFALTVTGQNIANVNTPGYTRQSVLLSASPSFGANSGLVGAGVTIDGVQQFRDSFVNTRLRTETAISGRLTAQSNSLTPVDAAFNETDGSGISSSMSSFFGAFQALEANPNSIPLRTDVIAKANAMTNAFSSTRTELTGIRSDTDHQLSADVDQVNGLSQTVADLNVKISTAENSNSSASELRDQRDQAVNQLAGLTGARSVEDKNGMVTLTLGDGQALVAGIQVNNLGLQNTPPNGLSTVVLNGQPAAINDGEMRGLQDAITTTSANIDSLDTLAASITTSVNALHTTGTDLNGNAGGNFFAVPAAGPVTAASFSVTVAVQGDPKLVVASPLAPPSASATIAGAIGALLDDPTSQAGTRSGSFSSIYASIVRDAGASVKSVGDAMTTQGAILSQAQAQRDSISGVSLDEEAINMLQYQKSYEAAARFLKVADDMTETILSLGQVNS